VPPNGFELETPGGTKVITMEMPPAEPVNAIKEELKAFAESILEGKPPMVPLQEGYEALRVAHAVMAQIAERLGK
jgi:predicted dehydrogenase